MREEVARNVQEMQSINERTKGKYTYLDDV
jgi:hypothetical protein